MIRILVKPGPCLADSPGSRRPDELGKLISLVRPAIDSMAIRVDAVIEELCHPPRLVEAPELDPARRIDVAVEASRINPPFRMRCRLHYGWWRAPDRSPCGSESAGPV